MRFGYCGLLALTLLLAGCGSTPGLHFASLKGETSRSDLMINLGEDVNKVANSGRAPLHFAAYNGEPETAELLLDYGADIDIRTNKKDETPLHIASQWGQLEMVELLLHEGAAVNARDHRGETPLYRAAMNYELEVVELLKEHGGLIPNNLRHEFSNKHHTRKDGRAFDEQ